MLAPGLRLTLFENNPFEPSGVGWPLTASEETPTVSVAVPLTVTVALAVFVPLAGLVIFTDGLSRRSSSSCASAVTPAFVNPVAYPNFRSSDPAAGTVRL